MADIEHECDYYVAECVDSTRTGVCAGENCGRRRIAQPIDVKEILSTTPVEPGEEWNTKGDM